MKKTIFFLVFILLSSFSYADDNAALQMRLANDAIFQRRVQFLLMKEAFAVMGESVGTPNHANRIAFATFVRSGIAGFVSNTYIVALVTRPNLIAATTTCDEMNVCVTNAIDAAISSQIATDWNIWAGQ